MEYDGQQYKYLYRKIFMFVFTGVPLKSILFFYIIQQYKFYPVAFYFF